MLRSGSPQNLVPQQDAAKQQAAVLRLTGSQVEQQEDAGVPGALPPQGPA